MTVEEFIDTYGHVEVKFASYYGGTFFFEGRVDGHRLIAKVANRTRLEVDDFKVALKDLERPFECQLVDNTFRPVVSTSHEIL